MFLPQKKQGKARKKKKKDTRKPGLVGCIYYVDCDDGIMGIFICRNNKLYMLNTCSSLYTNFSSIKLLREVNNPVLMFQTNSFL